MPARLHGVYFLLVFDSYSDPLSEDLENIQPGRLSQFVGIINVNREMLTLLEHLLYTKKFI